MWSMHFYCENLLKSSGCIPRPTHLWLYSAISWWPCPFKFWKSWQLMYDLHFPNDMVQNIVGKKTIWADIYQRVERINSCYWHLCKFHVCDQCLWSVFSSVINNDGCSLSLCFPCEFISPFGNPRYSTQLAKSLQHQIDRGRSANFVKHLSQFTLLPIHTSHPYTVITFYIFLLFELSLIHVSDNAGQPNTLHTERFHPTQYLIRSFTLSYDW